MIDLSSEDALRLNVLAAQADAVRIDEGKMTVFGLANGREVKVELNPTVRADTYLKQVRELLSGIALDSPGGYPIYLQRWTRMGQVDHDRLKQLLRLGEPEAVVAVACSPSLDDELAKLVWWASHSVETARRMLQNPRVVAGEMGPILARFLVEFLPYEAEPADLVESVRLVLQPGLIDEATREKLWSAGKRKAGYRVGFLVTTPGELPLAAAANPRLAGARGALEGLAAAGNGPAALLLKLLGDEGQAFLEVTAGIFGTLTQQEVTTALMNAIGAYCAEGRLIETPPRELDGLIAEMERRWRDGEGALAPLREALPDFEAEAVAALTLAHTSEYLLFDIFGHTDAVGSVLRKYLAPLTDPLLDRIAALRGA